MKSEMWKRFLLGLIGGLLGGAVGGGGGLLLVQVFFRIRPPQGGNWQDLGLSLLAVILLYPLGAALGAGWFLRRYLRRAMIWKAILIAFAAEFLVMVLAEPLHINLYPALMWSGIIGLPLIAVLLLYLFYGKKEEGLS